MRHFGPTFDSKRSTDQIISKKEIYSTTRELILYKLNFNTTISSKQKKRIIIFTYMREIVVLFWFRDSRHF